VIKTVTVDSPKVEHREENDDTDAKERTPRVLKLVPAIACGHIAVVGNVNE
jgi:hypothetical protein